MKVRVSENSQVSQTRRSAVALAAEVGMEEADSGRVAVIATEAATNLVKHTAGGEILVSAIREADTWCVELLSLDPGPGIADVAAAMRDGHSTAGSPGTGLGAMQRLADEFDIYSERGRGTIVVARIWKRRRVPASELQIGAVCEPVAGESVSGDAWAWRPSGRRTLVLVADGLGHGPEAARASRQAVATFEDEVSDRPAELLHAIHANLKSTRGAAAAIAAVDTDSGQLTYAGIGNISGYILTPGASRSLVSHNGTAGHELRKIQEFTYPWPADAVLLMHSDGITTHWNLKSYPGLTARHPSILAAALYRDQNRRRDDATVVAGKGMGAR